MQLPLSMIGRFSEGQHKVTAGGEELVLEFEAPRTLLGLGAFFASAELKANDRVQFLFTADSLELTALKRERPRGARGAVPNLQAGTSAAGGAAEASRPRTNDGSRLIGRGLFPAPAELAEIAAQPAQGAAAEDAGAEKAGPGPREGWHDAAVNSVRRVRIEGGLPPRANTAPPRPVDLASARDVWARRQNAPWRSLDTMVAGPVVPPEEAAETFSQTTIRVVRRSKGTSTPLEVEAPPLPRPEPEPAPRHRPDPINRPRREAPRTKPSSRPTDGASSPHATAEHGLPSEQAQGLAPGVDPLHVGGRTALDPYLDAPINASHDAYYAAPTILESDLLEVPSSGKWRTESEAAFLKYQEAHVATAAEPVAVPAERRVGLLGRLGLGRGSRGSSNAAANAPAQHDQHVPAERPAPPPATEPLLQASGEPGEQAGQEDGRRVIVDETVYDVDYDTEVQPHLLTPDDGAHSLESDMAHLQQYLGQPNVPAIVRCDDLAARLDMSFERVANAMLRLSEDRDLYTPLRGDAYMVRRAR